MPKMRAIDAVKCREFLAKEGATEAFGLPGAAINPLYSAMKAHGGIRHTLHRHVEGASHAADGYSRATGKIGLCLGTSGPAGTDMITGLYAAIADSIPMLCITGRLRPMCCTRKISRRWTSSPSPSRSPNTPPPSWSRDWFRAPSPRPSRSCARPSAPGTADLPINVQMAEIDFDIDAYEPLPVQQPAATRGQAEKIVDLLLSGAKPIIIAGGGIINANASGQLVDSPKS